VPVSPEEITQRIQSAMPDAQVTLQDLGGGDHWRAVVVSSEFEGKTLVEQHQLVYKAVRMHSSVADQSIHALSLKTMTPAEAGQA
jgi:stress-induced morphogen